MTNVTNWMNNEYRYLNINICIYMVDSIESIKDYHQHRVLLIVNLYLSELYKQHTPLDLSIDDNKNRKI